MRPGPDFRYETRRVDHDPRRVDPRRRPDRPDWHGRDDRGFFDRTDDEPTYERERGSRRTRPGGGRPAKVRRGRKRLLLVAVASVSAVLLGGVAVAATGTGGIRFRVTAPVTLQAIGLDVGHPAVGQTVSAGAKVVAERNTVLQEVAIAVSGPNGERFDFAHTSNWKLGTSQKLFVSSRAFDRAGTYTYWFAYRQGSRWVDLNPRQSFAVGDVPTTGTPTPTTPPTTQPPTPAPSTTPPTASGGCAAYPAVPTPACTGYAHTGVTLHDCTYSAAVTVYDSCRFRGTVVPSASNVRISRSLILGRVDYQTLGESLRGLTLTDVEINSTGIGPGLASIGGWDWTCLRCYVHGGSRGAAVGDDGGGNVTVQDSYLGDWVAVSPYHQTGLSGHGASHIRIIHNWIRCNNLNDPKNSGCSTALSIYGDSAVNNDWLIQYNRFDSGSSYCVGTYGTPGKPYGYTNIRILNNTFGDLFQAYWDKVDPGNAPHLCSQYGPIGGWTASAAKGNVASGNVDAQGRPITL
jgi:hypothetical protein